MSKETRNVILSGVIAALIASGTAVVLHIMQEDSISKQIEELSTQNSILESTLEDQQEQTKIMNQTLTNLQKSLEKESLISVKVLVHTEELHNPFGAGFSVKSGGGVFEREIYATESSIPLKANHTMKFDIIITNVGSDTAVLNGYQVQIFTDYGPSSSSWQTSFRDIRTILEANSSPMIIPFELEIEPKFAPKGEMFFVVSHDNGVNESYSLKYYYED